MTFESKKMDFLTLDKIFVLDNFNIVLDKKYFVRADGRGIKFQTIKRGKFIGLFEHKRSIVFYVLNG